MEPHSKKFKIYLGLIIILTVIFAGLAAYRSMERYKFQSPVTQETEPIVLEDEEGNITEDFYEEAVDTSYEELKERAPNALVQPTLATKEQRDKMKEAGDLPEQPRNDYVEFNGEAFEPSEFTTSPGNLITFSNNSDKAIKIIGEDDWGTYAPVLPGMKFSMRFDFIGEYDYVLDGDEQIKGVIVVER